MVFDRLKKRTGAHESKVKIFYVSLQRCGTKAFGELFKKNGYSVASWNMSHDNQWGQKCFEGKLTEVVTSGDFMNSEVFEDGPWYFPEVMRFVAAEVPNAKFVYFYRPAQDWFKSMVTHSEGQTLGNTLRHCHFYDRLQDYYYSIDHLGRSEQDRLVLFDKAEHYMQQHENHRLRVRAFFDTLPADRCFTADLYDREKYRKLNEAFGLGLPCVGDVHVHKSKRDVEYSLRRFKA